MLSFPTRSDAISSSISPGTNILFIGGYSTVCDLGMAHYKRSASEPSHAGKFQSADGAWWELAEAVVTPEMFGAVGDGSVNDTTALNNADAFNAPVRLQPGKTYLATGQLLLGQNSKKKWFVEGGRGAATIKSSYDIGNCIELGPDSATAAADIAFENIKWEQDDASDQTFFEIRSVRGCLMQNCRFDNIYFGIKIGTATRATYITELFDCEVHMRLAGHSAWMKTINTFGQIDLSNSYVEGNYSANSIGLDISSNVQARVDHLIMKGGYFSRFDKNIYINSRVVNIEMGACLHMEGHTTAQIHLDANGSFEKWNINGVMFGSGNGTSFLHHINLAWTQTGANCDGLNINGCTFSPVRNQPAIEIAAPSGNRPNGVNIVGNSFPQCTDNADNNHAVIQLNQINSGVIAANSGRNVNGSLRYAYLVRSTNSQAGLVVDANSHGMAGSGTGVTLRT